MEIGIGILAGGKSSRMGKDKSKLLYGRSNFLENIIEKFSGFDIIVSTNSQNISKIDNIKYIEDKYKDIGPISGILEILKESKYEYNFIIPVDMQNISLEFVEFLYTYICSDYKLFATKYYDEYNPLAGIYSKKIIPIIEDYIEQENYKLQNLLKENFCKVIDLKYSKFPKDILFNINTINDYNKLIKGNIISICGRKNSGKTTFISNLVEILKGKGLKIGVIKHDGHDFKLEDNTDTGKFYKAGTDIIGIFSDYKYMIYKNEYIKIEKLLEYFHEMDLIIIEGLKDSDFDKFEIIRNENSSKIITKKKLKGIITDIEQMKEQFKNYFTIKDIEIFAEFLIDNYIASKLK